MSSSRGVDSYMISAFVSDFTSSSSSFSGSPANEVILFEYYWGVENSLSLALSLLESFSIQKTGAEHFSNVAWTSDSFRLQLIADFFGEAS